MKKVFQKIFSLFKKTDPARKKNRRKTLGQSLVEFAITLPVLLILMTGVVEYGFMLNYYLSIVDATRDTARKISGWEPFTRDALGNRTGDDPTFYEKATEFGEQVLDPTKISGNETLAVRRIPLAANDDVIVSVYSIEDDVATQYPTTGPKHLHDGSGMVSRFTAASILADRLVPDDGTFPPNEGLVVVEIHYHYHQVLGIIVFTMFGNPVPLHAYTIMPSRAAEPQ